MSTAGSGGATFVPDDDYKLPFDPASPLVASGNLKRRMFVSRVAQALSTLGAFAAVAALGIMLYTVVSRGIGAISLDFLTNGPAEGGIGPALVGTFIITLLATLIATPIAVLMAIYTSEFASPLLGSAVKLTLDVMNGLPTIIVGIFIYGLIVSGRHQSGFAAAVALAIIMLPMIARTTQEVLMLVPRSLREGAEALGVPRWRVIIGAILPTITGAVLTAVVLAAARVAGETAPQILTNLVSPSTYVLNPFADNAMPNIPVTIYQLSEAADPTGFERAWGSALTLLTLILIANIVSRALLNRSRKKYEAL
jgi:phosphate transport system permease protein